MQRLDHILDEELIKILTNIKEDALGDDRFAAKICDFLSSNKLCRDVKCCNACPMYSKWSLKNTLKEIEEK